MGNKKNYLKHMHNLGYRAVIKDPVFGELLYPQRQKRIPKRWFNGVNCEYINSAKKHYKQWKRSQEKTVIKKTSEIRLGDIISFDDKKFVVSGVDSTVTFMGFELIEEEFKLTLSHLDGNCITFITGLTDETSFEVQK